ncbi:hypothetical protein AVEN_95470-1 [Araneus ventricosus]|uniref:Uncharacterized protein n=1 Tax=Araneus ventricosus TaxID=182803 RepID=A0A4Y2T198_ARAVE|nr:hypothetical protein AVEN_95470-1 [Araneus ventricosus]
MIMEDLSLHALDRITTMECELIFSNRLEIYRIERTDHGIPLPSVKSNKADGMLCPSVLEDLKTLYDDKFLCDIKLKTKSEACPAQIWYCAPDPLHLQRY